MNVVIQIQSVEMTEQGHKMFQELVDNDKISLQGKLKSVGFMEKGQASGKTAVYLLVETESNQIVVPVTQDIMKAILDSLEGAIQRFGK